MTWPRVARQFYQMLQKIQIFDNFLLCLYNILCCLINLRHGMGVGGTGIGSFVLCFPGGDKRLAGQEVMGQFPLGVFWFGFGFLFFEQRFLFPHSTAADIRTLPASVVVLLLALAYSENCIGKASFLFLYCRCKFSRVLEPGDYRLLWTVEEFLGFQIPISKLCKRKQILRTKQSLKSKCRTCHCCLKSPPNQIRLIRASKHRHASQNCCFLEESKVEFYRGEVAQLLLRWQLFKIWQGLYCV